MEEREEQPPADAPTDAGGGTRAPDESPATERPPAMPADDDSPLGDTDQHSDA